MYIVLDTLDRRKCYFFLDDGTDITSQLLVSKVSIEMDYNAAKVELTVFPREVKIQVPDGDVVQLALDMQI